MKIFSILFVLLFLMGCKKEVTVTDSNKDTIVTIEKAIDSHNSQNSLDWQGTYKGILPCADCSGIETEVVLNKDFTYVIKTKYLGKNDDKRFEEKGSFTWDASGSIITFQGKTKSNNQYKVQENQLVQLDRKGNVITGALADKYLLTK